MRESFAKPGEHSLDRIFSGEPELDAAQKQYGLEPLLELFVQVSEY
jgi:hypothetical protein